MSSAVNKDPAQRAKGEGKVTLRLARFGRHGQGGPMRYYFGGAGAGGAGGTGGRMYKRDGLYRADAALARLLLSTGKFEAVPEHLLEQAKREAKTPRGISLEQRAAERRRARGADRHRPHGLEEAERVMAAAPAQVVDADEPIVEV